MYSKPTVDPTKHVHYWRYQHQFEKKRAVLSMIFSIRKTLEHELRFLSYPNTQFTRVVVWDQPPPKVLNQTSVPTRSDIICFFNSKTFDISKHGGKTKHDGTPENHQKCLPNSYFKMQTIKIIQMIVNLRQN